MCYIMGKGGILMTEQKKEQQSKTEQEKKSEKELSCCNCNVYNCRNQNSHYPAFCLTTKVSEEEKKEIASIYASDTIDGIMARTAASIEGEFYCQKTRVEETILFAQRIGAKKVGVATCFGLINEAKTFCKVLEKNGIAYYCVICKVGGVDKREMKLPEDKKIHPYMDEVMCNPILQARILNRQKTDLNVTMGLCVGHDALFNKYSEAPVTNLIAKDRVLGHNPCAALYSNYYKRLYQ